MSLQDTSPPNGRHRLQQHRLPEHWHRGRRAAALLVLAAVVVVTFFLRKSGHADRLDLPWLMARFTVRQALRGPAQPDPNIILVNMDDRSSDRWPEPFIGWGGHIADAIEHLHVSGAKVIALDWTQPEETGKYLGKEFSSNDEKLAGALNDAGDMVMIVIARPAVGNQPAKFIVPFWKLEYALPDYPDVDRDLGYAELKSDQSIISALSPVQQAMVKGKLKSEKSLSARIVEHYLGGEGRLDGNHYVIPGKLSVPLRDDNTALINYAGDLGLQQSFQRYSMYDVAQDPDRPDPRFKDKIVIIGVTVTGFGTIDRSYVPFLKGLREVQSDGDEIQANQVRTLLSARPIHEPGNLGIWLLAVGLGAVGVLAFYILPVRNALITTLAAGLAWILASFILFLTAGYALPIWVSLIALATGAVMLGAYRNLREEHQRREVMAQWGTYQDPRVVHYLLQNPGRGGEGFEREVTVLFADLKNFTKTVEHLAPSHALKTLNSYLGMMAGIILEHDGVIDKYLGDGLMALWGAPEPHADHAAAAVRACLEIHRRAQELAATAGEITFGVRLTLHSGPVVVGFVGSSRKEFTRLEFTIIGDTVNVTSRLQETAKELGCEFLVSENVYNAVKGWVVTGKEAQVEIRGRQKPLRVYEVLEGKEAESDSVSTATIVRA